MILFKIYFIEYKINMDITLIENFQKQINTQFNEMVVSLLEQYQSELEDLNHILLKTTELIKGKRKYDE